MGGLIYRLCFLDTLAQPARPTFRVCTVRSSLPTARLRIAKDSRHITQQRRRDVSASGAVPARSLSSRRVGAEAKARRRCAAEKEHKTGSARKRSAKQKDGRSRGRHHRLGQGRVRRDRRAPSDRRRPPSGAAVDGGPLHARRQGHEEARRWRAPRHEE